MRTTAALVFLFVSLVSSLSLQLPVQPNNRRRFLERSGALIGPTWLLGREDAQAARGAAELDFEYYMRDLLGGNAKEGSVLSSPLPKAVPPRTLQDPLLSLLLNDDCTLACVPVEALQTFAPETNLSEKCKDYRSRVSRSFATRSPWQLEHVTDQYYFDLTSYALWRSAADMLPDYVDRDRFARNVGKRIYQKATKMGMLKDKVTNSETSSLTSTIPAMTEILDLFANSGFCKTYRIGDKTRTVVFDELDDEDLENGNSVDCLVSVYEPATLGASLQITGEQSRFSPEFVGTTLAAMWEEAGVKARFETYFVDNEYRPNPKDFFPNEQLLQFTLTKLK
jgi:hypothetical protein